MSRYSRINAHNDYTASEQTFQQLERHILDNELIPLASVACRLTMPVSDVELGESTGQIHHCDGNDLWLPLET